MLLLQYLLMRENLFPYLIDNSNKIPSFSVEELTRDYFKAEELMQKMLELNTEQQRIEFLSSDSLCAQNISLEDVFKEATEEEKNKYMAKIQQFDAAVQSYIDQQLMYNPPPLLN